MKLFVGQVYIQPGVRFSFSHLFQKWIGEKLTELIVPSDSFLDKYPGGYDVIFRLSAKSEIYNTEIKGPTVFKKDKQIEYTIFLPHRDNVPDKDVMHRDALERFFDAVACALESLYIDAGEIRKRSAELTDSVLSNDAMFKN